MSIYTRPQREQLQMVVGDAALSEELPFTARSVIVYNHTNQHVEFPDEGIFAPPQTSAWQLPLKDTGRAIAQFAAPPMAPDPAAINGQVCVLIYTEEELPASPGAPDGVIAVVNGFPTLGQHLMAQSLPVAVASNQSPLPVIIPTPVPVRAAGARVQAFASGVRANGTYTFDLPEETDLVGAVLYFNVSAGAGTVTFTVSAHDVNTGGDLPLLSSAPEPNGASGALAVYPGIAPVANQAASAVVGHTPRITAVVAGGGATFAAWLDPLS